MPMREPFLQSGVFTTKPRVLSIPSRQFPVTTHFERRTDADYVQQAYEKVRSLRRFGFHEIIHSDLLNT